MTDPRLKVQELMDEMIARVESLNKDRSNIIQTMIDLYRDGDWFEDNPGEWERATKLEKKYQSMIDENNAAIDTLVRKYTKILKKVYTIKKTEGVKSGKYPSKQTESVIKGLQRYWDDKLPIDQNRKTWFHGLADDNKLSFSAIEKIELKYRPTSFIPKSYL